MAGQGRGRSRLDHGITTCSAFLDVETLRRHHVMKYLVLEAWSPAHVYYLQQHKAAVSPSPEAVPAFVASTESRPASPAEAPVPSTCS
jgi:hypothetical protein